MPSPDIEVTSGYTDAKGHVHLTVCFPHPSGRTLRGEAIWDGSLGRVILGEEFEHLDRGQVVSIKRVIREKCIPEVS